MQTQIRRRRTRRLIRVSTVCKQFSHFSLGICRSHSRTYLKLKSDSSNILCGRVYSVYNGLKYKYHPIPALPKIWTRNYVVPRYSVATWEKELSDMLALPRFKSACASAQYDQFFAVRMRKHCILRCTKCVHWRFWSDCANAAPTEDSDQTARMRRLFAQADLNLRLERRYEGTFPDVAAHL